jgi:hypothetical protein
MVFQSRVDNSLARDVFVVKNIGALEVAQRGGNSTSQADIATFYQADQGVSNAFFKIGNYATTGTGGYATWLRSKSSGSGVQYGVNFDVNANVNNAGDGFGIITNIHNNSATITGSNPLYDIRNNGTMLFRLFPSGALRLPSLGTAQNDTTTNKPLGLNSSGDVVPMIGWPVGAGLPTQTGNAGKALTTNGTTASWNNYFFPWDFASRDSATTSNAVATTLATINIDNDTRGIIEVRLEGINATQGLTGIKRVRWKKIGSTLTLGTVEDEMAIERDGGLTTATFTISTSSNNIIIQVTGEASTTLDWKATYFINQKIAPL